MSKIKAALIKALGGYTLHDMVNAEYRCWGKGYETAKKLCNQNITEDADALGHKFLADRFMRVE